MVQSPSPRQCDILEVCYISLFCHTLFCTHTHTHMHTHTHTHTLINTQVKRDLATNKSRGFGFVRYFDYEIQKKVQTMKHVIKGRRVDIKYPKKVGVMFKLILLSYVTLYNHGYVICHHHVIWCKSKDQTSCCSVCYTH